MSLLPSSLEAFIAVVETGTVVAASARLGLTQTGATQRIRALETRIGSTLFTRSRQGMRLTESGEALLRYCRSARELEGATLARIRGAGETSSVRAAILGPTSAMRTRVVPAVAPVLEKFPELSVTFEITDEKSGTEALRTGDVELAVVPRESVARELDSKVLRPEEYVLVAKRGWQRRPLREVIERERIVDFSPGDGTTHSYLRKHGLLAHARADRHFVNNNEALLELLERGLGYGVLTREFADLNRSVGKRDLAILAPEKSFEHRLALAWYPRPQPGAYFAALIRAIH